LAETVLAMAEILVIEHRCDEPYDSFKSLGGDRLVAMGNRRARGSRGLK